MDAWSGDPIPPKCLENRTALERQGALVFQVKQCRNCHELGRQGGKRGPALDSVAVVKTRDQLFRQVIQGGGNMPAYGKNFSPAETTALVTFLVTLHPAGQAPARDASRARLTDSAGREPAVIRCLRKSKRFLIHSIHVIQHPMRMLVVPPLILLSAPVMPFLYGMPQWFAR
jgi:cytochrome c5